MPKSTKSVIRNTMPGVIDQAGSERLGRRALCIAISGALMLAFQTPSMAQSFPPVLELSSIDGTNGFYFNGESEEDNAGFSVSGLGDFNGDGIDDPIIGAPYASPNGNYSGRSYILFGSATGFSEANDLSDLNGSNGFAISGQVANDRFGHSVSAAGDLNNDGLDDLVVGARYANANGNNSGRSYVLFGSSQKWSAEFDLADIDGINGFTIDGEAAEDSAGQSVSNAGDVNGDGIDDLIVGAYGNDVNGDYSGRSYVVFGSAANWPINFQLSSIDASSGIVFNGEAGGGSSGNSVSDAGDFNGDSIDDIIIGAENLDSNEDRSGRSYLIFGSETVPSKAFELSDLNGSNGFAMNGQLEFDRAGQAVSSAGDINGDGFDDLLVSAPTADVNDTSSGSVYVLFGSASTASSAIELASLDGQDGFIINGQQGGDTIGGSISGAGDLNGDGIDDFVIGAMFVDTNGENSGRSYIIFGTSATQSSPFNLGSLDGRNGFVIDGAEEGDRAGASVSSAGDINGDGMDDLIIGASETDTAAFYAGRVYVVYGRREGVFTDRFEQR